MDGVDKKEGERKGKMKRSMKELTANRMEEIDKKEQNSNCDALKGYKDIEKEEERFRRKDFISINLYFF